MDACSDGRPYGLARLAGVIGGLTGFAIADLASWFLAPAAAPLTAVGLRHHRSAARALDQLGQGDAGHRRQAGAAGHHRRVRSSPSAQSPGSWNCGDDGPGCSSSVPSRWWAWRRSSAGCPDSGRPCCRPSIGLSAGYLVVYLLVTKLARSVEAAAELDQPEPGARAVVEPDHASAPDLSGPVVVQRRSFLRATVLIGAGAAVAAVVGRMLVDGAAKIAEARSRIRLPAPARPAKPIPSRRRPPRSWPQPVRDSERDVLPHRHGAAGARDRSGRVDPQGHGPGRAGGHDHLRRPAGPAVDRAHDHAHVRVQRGRRQPGRQRDLARPADPRPAGRGAPAPRSRHGPVPEPRRLDGGNPARRAAGERTASPCWPWR